MCIFVAIASFFRGSTSAGHAGTVAAFTVPVLLLSSFSASLEEEIIVFRRIEETIFAIVIWLVVEFAFWPQRAGFASLGAVVNSLEALALSLRKLQHFDMDSSCSEPLAEAPDIISRPYDEAQVAATLVAVSSKVSLARRLVAAAEQEPECWRRPFPAT